MKLRHFRNAIGADRRLKRHWQAFEAARRREEMIAWLQSIGVEPVNSDETAFEPPPLPDLRNIMFAEVRRFVQLARDIPGVLRIALLGSLTTSKEFPKDIDALVTVSDDCDLTELARLGRQLSGRMTQHQAGADVFLANPAGEYLGRTCPWKDCGPGYRMRCDALHCGARHYLHDDWNTIRLSRKVVTEPPVLLWPDVAATPT